MDVRCERCATEYDFDDALVSERGTTVKCTNCGHQFKVFPARSGGHPERWVVRTEAGRELVYTSLRDLQRGISEGQVGPDDLLSRGGQAPRPLGSIAELEPFFRPPKEDAERSGRHQSVASGEGSLATSQESSVDPDAFGADSVLSTRNNPGGSGQALSSAVATGRSQTQPSAVRVAPTSPLTSSDQESPKGSGAGSGAATRESPHGTPRARVTTVPIVPVPGDTASGKAPAPEDYSEASQAFASLDSDPPTVRRASLAEEAADVGPRSSRTSPVKTRPVAPGLLPSTDLLPLAAATAAGAHQGNYDFPERGQTEPLPGVEVSRGTDAEVSSGPAISTDGTARLAIAPSEPPSEGPAKVQPAPAEAPGKSVEDPAGGHFAPVPNTPGRFGASRRSRISLEPDSADQFFTPAPGESQIGSSLSDPDYRYVPAAHVEGTRARWVGALVLLGLLALVGGTVGVRYLTAMTGPTTSVTSIADPRLRTLLETGVRAIDDGDLEAAHAALAKASMLAENDPAVLAEQARLETTRADLGWLRLRLLDPKEAALTKAARLALTSRLAKARAALDAASRLVPSDPVVLRASVDFWRISGDLPKARSLVEELTTKSNNSANGYTLAALDLAEANPKYRVIAERLRGVATSEGDLGLGAGTLIYALSQSGAIDLARVELRKLADNQHPYALLAELQGFVDRQEAHATDAAPPTASGARPSLGSVDHSPGAQPSTDRGGQLQPPRETTNRDEADDKEIQNQLWLGKQALRSNQPDRALQHFRAILAKHPRHFEAQAGLAEAERRAASSRSPVVTTPASSGRLAPAPESDSVPDHP